ncbi:hypothetical protein RB195_001501 [Necator americanus]|uniref:MULE transposase domain-containing protein n=1 Tax=Necator americanus TaxID=51031 RepID=A0ABR1DEL2_NECAM
MAKNRMERHLVDVHGYSQAQISEFKAQKKSRRIAVSGKPIYNCEFCDATFNSIIVINPTQKEWLRKYGQRALCVDDTFNLTSYSLRLATVIVADEWDRALPAAYLLSYRMTDMEVGLMFEHVKKLLPSFHTDNFITDDTNTFWNGFSKVFPSSWTKRLLCLWHVQQTIKRNANAKLVNRDLSEPFLRKMRDICLVRERSVFVTQYTSMLKYLRENDESTLASYMENTWSNRVDQWAAFGRLGSCVSTSMLCERFHKKLKHEMLEGKANVRIDRLLQLLIALTTELEEDREIMKERGLEEGRYRLQQHHKAHTSAVNKYCGQQQLVTVVGPGTWEVKENSNSYRVEEYYCPCDKDFNNHCRREGCGACPYAFACTCPMDVKSGISCVHVHATLMYAKSGRRSHRDDVSSVFDGEVENEHNGPYSSDGDEEMMEVVVVDDVENESVARNSTDVEDRHKDMFQRMEMMYASARESMLKVMREPTEGTGMEIEQVLQQMDELTKRLGLLAENVGRNGDTARLARRHDVPPVGCPQALTPIRKQHKTVRRTRGTRVLYAFGCSLSLVAQTIEYAGFNVQHAKTGCMPTVSATTCALVTEQKHPMVRTIIYMRQQRMAEGTAGDVKRKVKKKKNNGIDK